LPARVRIAVAWYADGIRSADIAATAKLSGHQLVRQVREAGLVCRSEEGRTAALPLLHVLRAVQGGATAEGLRSAFGLTANSIAGVFALHWQSHPPAVRRPPPEMQSPPRRCRTCRGVTVHNPGRPASCQWCGDPL
jgi:hypothetical protein